MSTALALLHTSITGNGGRCLRLSSGVALAALDIADDDTFLAFASSLGDDFDEDNPAAEKFARNHGFLKGLLIRIRNTVTGTNPNGMSLARKTALVGSILFACTALRLAATQPEKFGRLGAQTAKVFLEWVVEMGKFVVYAAKGVGSFLLGRLRSLLKYLQSLRAPLAAAARSSAYNAGRAYEHMQRNL